MDSVRTRQEPAAERRPESTGERLKERYLFHLTGDDPAEVEAFLDRHPEDRDELEAFGRLHGALCRELEEWGRQRPEEGLPEPGQSGASIRVRIPGYRVLREIGRGGMGVVFRARDLEAGDDVAIKVFQISSGSHLRARFLREAEIISRLDSPRIVSIRRCGAEDTFLYYVMELLEGETFAECIRRWHDEPPAVRCRQAAEIGVDICAALEVLHSQGIIHRDLKPSNVFITEEDGVKLLDFGLARDLGATTLTVTGEIVGTLAYMSPEQILGDRRRVDRRSDIFSTGASLYEAITLKRPFDEEGKTPRFAGILDCDPEPPREVEPEIPADLSAIVQKAMEFEPGMRYATAGDLAMDLRRFLAWEPVLARPVTGLGRIHRRLRRKKRLLAPILIFLVLTAAAAVAIGALSAGAAKRGTVETALDQARSRAGEAGELRHRLESERRLLEGLEKKVPGVATYEERRPVLEARSEVARLEGEARSRFDGALLAAQRGLETAPRNPELLRFLEGLLWDRYLEAEVLGDVPELKRLEALILSYVPHLLERLAARGEVSIESDPPGAEVRLFRYEAAGFLLRPVPYHPRIGKLLEVEEMPPFALEIVREPHRFLTEHTGLRLGDRILSVSGYPVGPTGKRVLTKIDRWEDPAFELVVERGPEVLHLPGGIWMQDDLDMCIPVEFSHERLNDCTEMEAFPLFFPDEGRLGPTPLKIAALEAGSYLCVLRHPGRRDTRVPFVVSRGGSAVLKVRMFTPEQIPEGFVHVPAGPAVLGGDPAAFHPEPARRLHLEDFFISRREVGFSEYFEFLNDPAIRGEIEEPGGSGAGLLPVEMKEGKLLPAYRIADGRLVPENRKWAAWGAHFVSKLAAERYARWMTSKERSRGSRWTFELPSADEFEKAARGADGRLFPWGSTFDWSLTCTHASNSRHSDRLKPFATDCSPYGVLDLAGSLAEWTRTLDSPPGVTDVQLAENLDCRVKGGSGFDELEPFFHLGGHDRERSRNSSYRIGFRLVAYPSPEAEQQSRH